MLERIPVPVWLLIPIVAAAYLPARYVYRHVTHSEAGRDLSRPPEDLSWRTGSRLMLNLTILAALAALAWFLFTPTAAQFARSPSFMPILLAAGGIWCLFTVPVGLAKGRIELMVRGFDNSYKRKTQPKRFWASLGWNAILGCLCLFLAFHYVDEAPLQGLEGQCYDPGHVYAPQDEIAACNQLIAARTADTRGRASLIATRGLVHYRMGDYRRAAADYSEAIRLDPDEPSTFFNRGLADEKLGDRRQALADYTAAIRTKPSDADAYQARASILLDTRRYDDAIADFTRAHQLQPTDPMSLAGRGLCYAWKQDAARAEADFAAVRKADPDNVAMLRGEALLRMNAGDLSGAVERLNVVLRDYPGDPWSLMMRASLYRGLDQIEKADADIAALRLQRVARPVQR